MKTGNVEYVPDLLYLHVSEAFRVRDKDQAGTISIGFEDFLTVALGCSM